MPPQQRRSGGFRRSITAALFAAAVVVAFLYFADRGPTATGTEQTAIVERVVDGDTVIVFLANERTRVRLLNIDTPESVDPNSAVECLGPEASDYLRELLPEGTAVRLDYDETRFDQYDRTLAAVYVDDLFVNAQMARVGLAEPIVVGDNDRFFDEVDAASDEAREAGVGLFAPDSPCGRID